MNKKVKIKIVDSEKFKFELVENATAGDYFFLSDLTEIDFSQISSQIHWEVQNIQNKEIKEKIEIEKQNWANEFQLKINEDFKKKDAHIKDLENFITSLENKIKSNNENKNIEIELAVQKNVNELKTEIEVLKSQKQNYLEVLQKNKDISELQKQSAIEKIKTQYEVQIEKIKREKSSNIKKYGEELETWINSEYINNLGLIDDCEFIKTTKAIDRTKPDFLFTVFSRDHKIKLGSVTIEAKTQFLETEDTGKKNSNYYNALEKNRINNKSDFSLLITELEPNDDFLIKKNNDPNFKNMFICRPAYFITFLTMVRLLYKKQEELNNIEAISFEEKQKILTNFEEMKDNILNKTVKNIQHGLEKILKKSQEIEKSARDIQDAISVIIESHLEALKNKIESFQIRKISKQIEQSS